jgi:hypothetical protein
VVTAGAWREASYGGGSRSVAQRRKAQLPRMAPPPALRDAMRRGTSLALVRDTEMISSPRHAATDCRHVARECQARLRRHARTPRCILAPRAPKGASRSTSRLAPHLAPRAAPRASRLSRLASHSRHTPATLPPHSRHTRSLKRVLERAPFRAERKRSIILCKGGGSQVAGGHIYNRAE